MPLSDELLLKLIYQEENQKLLDDASAKFDKLSQSEKDLNQQSAETADGFSKVQAGLVTLQSGISLVETSINTLKKAWDFVKEGAAIERINAQWERTAENFGENGAKIIEAVNQVTGNTIDDEQIMQAATRTLTQGLVTDGAQIVQMFKTAQAMSVAFGGSAIEAFQAESMAIETGMSRQLRAQGITVDFEAAYKKYAEAVGKTTEKLSDEEKQTVRLNEVLEKGAVLVAKVGDATNDQLSKIQRAEKQFKELGDSIEVFAAQAIDALDVVYNGPAKIEAAFHASTSKIQDDLIAGRMTLEDYNNAIDGMTNAIMQAYPQLGATLKAQNLWNQALLDGARFARALKEEIKGVSVSAPAPENDLLLKRMQANLKEAPTNINALSREEQQTAAREYQSFQGKLSDIENKGYQDRVKIVTDATNQINQLEMQSRDKRISILTSYAEDEQKITDEQNKQRLDLAKAFGIETERMERDHQREMQRMAEDHGKRLSKLADSRDALGIEDEIDNYETQRRRAEEDYQTSAGRRNEDYAQQLKDQSENFDEQRKARTQEKDKQLNELRINEENTRRAIQSAEDQKLLDLNIAMANDRIAANIQWRQWREEHGIFLEGEKVVYDEFLQYQLDALKSAMGQPTSGGSTDDSGILHARAHGGVVNPWGVYTVGDDGPETLRMFGQGGYVTPNRGSSRGGNQFSVEINVAGTNASVEDIKMAVYSGIKEVMEAAGR